MLETVGVAVDEALLDDWRARVERARLHLGWPALPVVARTHAGGASLALAAPVDELFTATEVNEWALCSAVHTREPERWPLLESAWRDTQPENLFLPPVLDEGAALVRLSQLSGAERKPALTALLGESVKRALPWLLDDEQLTLGLGAEGCSWPLTELPETDEVAWRALKAIPVALVTGSNGKTTIVRLIAACTRAQGWHTGLCSTDGVFVDDETLEVGDYSGPAGARTVLRHTRVEAAVLETARGGILRRGLAIPLADAAVVSNLSVDHFGEYGIHDLESLADVKLTVGRAVRRGGLLVVNADDALLARKAPAVGSRLGWFALEHSHPLLLAHRERGGATAGVADGKLILCGEGEAFDLGAVADMPIAQQGASLHNVANLAAAALAARALGVSPDVIATVFARFGADPADNPGRLMRYEVGGIKLLVDFAHNPAALRGVLTVAQQLRAGGRLGLLLGQAGNRRDDDLRGLATVAAEFRPDLVVLKELADYLRGRAEGEVTALLRAALIDAGVAGQAIAGAPGEIAAVRLALDWARPGDVLVLLVHTRAGRSETLELIGSLRG